jgi:uncharacterized membrane protein
MERWIVSAFVSMLFTGLTAVIVKGGLKEICGETGLVVQTGIRCHIPNALRNPDRST